MDFIGRKGAVEEETGVAVTAQGVKALLDGVHEGLLQSDLQRGIEDSDECWLQIPGSRKKKGERLTSGTPAIARGERAGAGVMWLTGGPHHAVRVRESAGAGGRGPLHSAAERASGWAGALDAKLGRAR